MSPSADLREFVKGWEKLRLFPYRDIGGKWTVGWGHLQQADDDHASPVTTDEAVELLTGDLEAAAAGVRDLVTVTVTQCQFDALCSFVFNMGQGRLEISTLLKRLNAGDYIDAGEQFLVWNCVRERGAMVPTLGLTKRRRAERSMFVNADYSGRP